MTLEEFNALDHEQATAALFLCCGSPRWAKAVAGRRPFASSAALFKAADEDWWGLNESDWLEAFSHHPRIGGKDAMRAKFAATRQWAQSEQATVAQACEQTIEALARGNEDYERRFGYIFIVCATGKSAEEMLALLRARLRNEPQAELKLAAGEQAKITLLRLQKMVT